MVLQADPFIQAATNTQSYNRYSYTFNNPLNATDPSGYISLSGSFKKSIDKYAGAIASVAIIAACYGACTAQVLGAWLATAAAINAKLNGASGFQIFTAAVLAYAGGAAGGLGGTEGLLAAGVLGGVSAQLNGGNFGNGFVTSLASSYLGGKVGNSKSSLVRIGGASIIGGTSSKLTGGKFVSGAATSAFSAALVDKKVEANQQVAIEKDKLIREFANKIACAGNCGEAIASALKAASAQKGPPGKYNSILKTGNIDLDANAKAAAGMNLKEFVDQVKPGGDWDYKNSSTLIKALKAAEVYDAPLLAEFGNWHFGYVSAANGNGLGFSLMGAGVVQAFWQGGGNRAQALQGAAIYSYDEHMVRTITSGGFTWGDRSDDPIPIMNGWDYYHE